MKTSRATIWQSPKDKQWRWHLKSANGRIIAESGEGYKTNVKCEHGLKLTAEFFDRTALRELVDDRACRPKRMVRILDADGTLIGKTDI